MKFLNINKHKLILLFLSVFVFTAMIGCSGGPVDEETTNYTVIYDGNGGFLGNKTYRIRKLEVAENSKIPKYLQEYSQDAYVVSSLGLANRDGYLLKGWYLIENAAYSEALDGTYVYLDKEDGNGTYIVNETGQYVYNYVIDSEGKLIYIYFETPAEDADTDLIEYIYMEGSSGYGFYVYDDSNAGMVAIYEADGGYSYSYARNYGTYKIFNDLTASDKTLFADAQRYTQTYVAFQEGDENLIRYNFESGYIQIDGMFVSDINGNYVLMGSSYVAYDPDDAAQTALNRFSIDQRYVFTPNDTVSSPSQLTKYEATFEYWDFENQRVNSDVVLYAHWEKKLSVDYKQMNGAILTVTTKQNEENTGQVNLVVGETIGGIETIPKSTGYTFVGWSKSETEYIPWDFANDVFPSGISKLTLYAYMVPGTYIRITNEIGLASVVTDPNANYLLCSDIDLGGKEYVNSSPLGFTVQALTTSIVPFTGEFKSMGYKISNFTMKVQNYQKPLFADNGISVVLGLFPYVQDASIDGLTIENVDVVFDTTPSSKSVICELGGAALIGTALDGTTTVNNVSVDVTFSATTADTIDYPVYVGDIVAIGAGYVSINSSTAVIDYSSVTGISTDSLELETLN